MIIMRNFKLLFKTLYRIWLSLYSGHMTKESSKDLRNTGTLAHKSVVMPADLNTVGTLFGGTMLAYFDLAGAVIAVDEGRKPVVLAAMNNAQFYESVHQGYTLAIYGEVEKVGRTSITVVMQAWKHNRLTGNETLCAESTATYVCVDSNLKPTPVKGKN